MAIANAAQARAATNQIRAGRNVDTAAIVARVLAKVESHLADDAKLPGRPRRRPEQAARVLPYILAPFAVPEGVAAPTDEAVYYAQIELERAGFVFRLLDSVDTGPMPVMGWDR